LRIGYYVQGTADEAFVHGLKKRWCPDAELAMGKFRGASKQSFRREIAKALVDLRDDKGCDVLVVLTDSDTGSWREIRQREWDKVPVDCQHLAVFGVAERNIECWLAIDRNALADELDCQPDDIPRLPDDPAGFVKRRFGLTSREVARETAVNRIADFVARVGMKPWIDGSKSFNDFYQQTRNLATTRKCLVPNELERS